MCFYCVRLKFKLFLMLLLFFLAVRPNWSQPTGRGQLVAADWSQRTTGRGQLVATNWSHGTTGRGQLVAELKNSFSEITLKIFCSSNFFSYTISYSAPTWQYYFLNLGVSSIFTIYITILRDTHPFLSPTLFPPDNPKFFDGPKYVLFDQNFWKL